MNLGAIRQLHIDVSPEQPENLPPVRDEYRPPTADIKFGGGARWFVLQHLLTEDEPLYQKISAKGMNKPVTLTLHDLRELKFLLDRAGGQKPNSALNLSMSVDHAIRRLDDHYEDD